MELCKQTAGTAPRAARCASGTRWGTAQFLKQRWKMIETTRAMNLKAPCFYGAGMNGTEGVRRRTATGAYSLNTCLRLLPAWRL